MYVGDWFALSPNDGSTSVFVYVLDRFALRPTAVYSLFWCMWLADWLLKLTVHLHMSCPISVIPDLLPLFSCMRLVD